VGEVQRGTWNEEMAPLINGPHYEERGSTRDQRRGSGVVARWSALRGTREYEERGTRNEGIVPGSSQCLVPHTPSHGATRKASGFLHPPSSRVLTGSSPFRVPRSADEGAETDSLAPRSSYSLIPRNAERDQTRSFLVPRLSYSLVPRTPLSLVSGPEINGATSWSHVPRCTSPTFHVPRQRCSLRLPRVPRSSYSLVPRTK
jgi:hypothetical protein